MNPTSFQLPTTDVVGGYRCSSARSAIAWSVPADVLTIRFCRYVNGAKFVDSVFTPSLLPVPIPYNFLSTMLELNTKRGLESAVSRGSSTPCGLLRDVMCVN